MISKKTKYALKALIVLARHYSHRQPTLISELAASEKLPRKFLESILLGLKNEGILASKKGKGGGYLLAKNPDRISVGQIVRVLEGTLSPLSCLSQRAYRKCDECREEATCPIRSVMKEVREETVRILDGTSLQDMLERTSESMLSYSI